MIIDNFKLEKKEILTSAVLSSYLTPLENKIIPIEVGQKLSDCINDDLDVVIYDINNVLVSTEHIVQEGEKFYIYTIPQGGSGADILKTVAIIAVAVAVNYYAPMMFGGTAGGAGALGVGGQIGVGLSVAGATMLTAYALNKMFPPDIPSMGGYDLLGQDSSTYGWGDTSNKKVENAVLPILLGTHRITPPYINAYVDTAQDGKQTLNQLFALNFGTVDSISSVKINDNDIGNYEAAYQTLRYGTKNQEIITEFHDLRQDYGKFNIVIDSDWYQFQSSGNAVTQIGIGVTFQGLGAYDNAGNIGTYEVELEAQYSANGVNWNYIQGYDYTDNDARTFYQYGSDFTTTSEASGYTMTITNKYDGTRDANGLSLYMYDATFSRTETKTGYHQVCSGGDDMGESPRCNYTFGTSTETYSLGTQRLYSTSNYNIGYSIGFGGYSGSTQLRGYVDWLPCSAATQESRNFFFKSSVISEDSYFIRVRRKTADNTSTRVLDKCIFSFHSEYNQGINQRFPSVALLGIKALATDQLNGSLPKVTALVSRLGQNAHEPLNNPAWACKFIIENYLNGSVNDYAFSQWASYCNSEDYTVNIYIETQLSMRKFLDMIASLGQGYVFQKDYRTWECRYESKDVAPVQSFIFNDSNISYNSYSEKYLPIEERFNTLELTYFDEYLEYDRNIIVVQNQPYDVEKKTSLVLYGCTNRPMALKLGKIALRKLRYETLISSWKCGIDALHCSLYDIVYVQHSTPKWNGGVGSLIKSATINTITLDQQVTLDVGYSYKVRVQHINTDIVEERYTVPVSTQTITDTLIFTSDFDNIPVKNSKYTFKDGRYFKIINISQSDELNFSITAVEYIPEIYDVSNDDIPIYNSTLSAVSDVSIGETLRYNKQGVIEPVLYATWNGVKLNYTVEISKNGGAYEYHSNANINNVSIYDVDVGITYKIKVDGVESDSYLLQGKLAKPQAVSNLSGSESGNRFYLSWDYDNPPLDFEEFRIYKESELIGSTKSLNYETPIILATESVSISVVAVDTSNVESNISSVSIEISDVEPVVSLSGYVLDGNLNLEWEYTKPFDFGHFDIYNEGVYVGNSTKNTYIAKSTYHPIGNTTYSVVAVDLSGNESEMIDVVIPITIATLSNFEYTFNKNVCTLTWDITNNSFPIKEYIVNEGIKTIKTSTTRVSFDVDWIGLRTISITAVDTANNTVSFNTSVTITTPSVPSVSASSSSTSGVEFIWTCANEGSLGIKEYVISYNGNVINTKDTKYFIPITTALQYTLTVDAIDWSGNNSGVGSHTYSVSYPDVYGMLVASRGYDCVLTFNNTEGTFKTKDFLIEYSGISKYITTQSYTFVPSGLSAITFTVTPRDIAGNLGTARQLSFTPLSPSMPTVEQNINGKDLFLNIVQTQRTFNLSYVEIAYDDKVVNSLSGSSSWSIPIYWDLSKVFTITSIDVLGNRSAPNQITVNIEEGEVTSIQTDVIDNNVMLKWEYTEGTLPIEHFLISKGADYISSVEIGTRKGSFTAIFEREAGIYTYWITPIDTAGNSGVYMGATTSVSQPPDFVLNAEWDSNFSGTNTNVYIENGNGILPVNNTQTFEQHFTSMSWTTPNAQVSAGYPIYITPSASTASVVQQFDYGTTLGSTNITLSDPIISKIGTGTYSFTRQISTSLDGTSWTNAPANSSMIFVTNIRYVKVTYVYTCSTNTVLNVGKFKLRLDAKIINDSGTKACVSTDAGGTVVTFNKHFVDVSSISVTPSGTTPLIAIYDFVDVPNPTSFKVLLFTTAGVRASGNVSWSCKGY